MGDDDEEVVDNTAKANRADMNKLGGGGGDDDGGVDSDAAKKRALEMANDDLKKEKEAEAARLKELMAVKISQEDVATIVSEIEVEKKAAEMRLREHGGDVVAALKSYVKG
jgi:NACalpha-BTF3-like transcription factor|tara:strand:+ start:459 stop:791 length:333 start_codon:yes stop_codon:yes gene_type:complete